MKNIEKYKQEMNGLRNNCDFISNHREIEEVLCEYQRCRECLLRFVDWLCEESEESIKLKKWEYDLLECLAITGKFNENNLISMKNKGYFKGIKDTSMSIEKILENCEVEEDE